MSERNVLTVERSSIISQQKTRGGCLMIKVAIVLLLSILGRAALRGLWHNHLCLSPSISQKYCKMQQWLYRRGYHPGVEGPPLPFSGCRGEPCAMQEDLVPVAGCCWCWKARLLEHGRQVCKDPGWGRAAQLGLTWQGLTAGSCGDAAWVSSVGQDQEQWSSGWCGSGDQGVSEP